MWSAILSIVASVAKFFVKRNEDKNAPDVEAAAKAQNQVDEKSKFEKNVANKDVDAARRDWSDN